MFAPLDGCDPRQTCYVRPDTPLAPEGPPSRPPQGDPPGPAALGDAARMQHAGHAAADFEPDAAGRDWMRMRPQDAEPLAGHAPADVTSALQARMPDAAPGFSPDRLHGPARAAYDRLPPDQQAQYGHVYAASGPDGRARLNTLLEAGTLQQRDRGGRTLLQNLDRLTTSTLMAPSPVPQGYRQGVMDTVLQHLTDPRSITQGANDTCGATTIQRDFAGNRPADYVAFVTGLLSPDGRATLPSGRTVIVESGSIGGRAGDRRDVVSRAVQSTFMEMGPLDYSYGADGQGIGVGDYHLRLFGGMMGEHLDEGLTGTRGEATAIMTRRSVFTTFDGGGELGTSGYNLVAGVSHELRAQQQSGRARPMVPIAMRWGGSTMRPGFHVVAVVGLTTERVTYANPQGNLFALRSKQNPAAPLQTESGTNKRYIEVRNPDNGLMTRYYDDGLESVSFADMQANIMEAAVSPATHDRYQIARAPEQPGR